MIYSFSVFRDKVASGEKRQTIRRWRSDGREPKPGDRLDLWWKSRRPERFKFGEAICTEVFPIRFWADEYDWTCRVHERNVDWAAFDDIAKRDGFDDPYQMLGWFGFPDSPPFDGYVIRWGELDATKNQKRGKA